MPLSPGMRIGPYEITGAIGAGGMGGVSRARDTEHGGKLRAVIHWTEELKQILASGGGR